MKDPRFSATLHSWLNVGRLNRDHLKVVRVTRRPEAAAASVMKHREVSDYCGNDLGKALAMTEVYDANAAWTAGQAGIPVCEVAYESLITNPAHEVGRLANYLGIDDAARMRHCSRLIGKRRALFAHYIRKAASPGRLADTIVKTIRAKLPASG